MRQRRSGAVRGRPPAQPVQLTLQRRRRRGAMNVAERTAQGASVQQLRAAPRGSGQPVLDQRLGLRDADPLDRHRHHDAGEAGA